MWNGTNGFHHPIMKIIFTNSCLMTTFIQLQNCNAQTSMGGRGKKYCVGTYHCPVPRFVSMKITKDYVTLLRIESTKHRSILQVQRSKLLLNGCNLLISNCLNIEFTTTQDFRNNYLPMYNNGISHSSFLNMKMVISKKCPDS